MNEEFLEQIENERLKEAVFKKENIPILEDILDKEVEEYKKLKRLKEEKKLNLGAQLTRKELRAIFPEIKKEVDEFLGVSDIKAPKVGHYNIFQPRKSNFICGAFYTISGSIGYVFMTQAASSPEPFVQIAGTIGAIFGGMGILATTVMHKEYAKGNAYSSSEKRIDIKRNQSKVRDKLIIGHEYTHHLLNEKGISQGTDEYESFSEGIGRAVERHLAARWSEKEDNQAYIYDSLDRSLYELKKAYREMCRESRVKRNKSLLRIRTTFDDGAHMLTADMVKEMMPAKKIVELVSKINKIDTYDIGNAYFRIEEAKHGQEIYKGILASR